MGSFVIENVSVPPEVEAGHRQAVRAWPRSAISTTTSSSRWRRDREGRRGRWRRRRGNGRRDGDGAADDQSARRHRRRRRRRRPEPAAPRRRRDGVPETLEPGRCGQSCSASAEADVIASLEAGDLKGKRIGTQWRITRARDRRLSEVARAWTRRRTPRRRRGSGRRPVATGAREVSLSGLRRRGPLESGASRRSSVRSAAPSRPRRSRCAARDTVIVEHDLVAALRAIPDSARGWQAEKTSVRCQSCQAISVFDPGQDRPALRLLRLRRARAVRAGQGRVPARVAAAAEDLRVTGARSDSRVVRQAVARAERVRARRRSPTR